METITRKDSLTFHKWDTQGQTVDVVITDAPVYDKANDFGGKDNFFRGVISGTESRIQVPMPYDLKKKIEQVADSIVLGETRFVITFESTKKVKGKPQPLKLFDVKAEGLKE